MRLYDVGRGLGRTTGGGRQPPIWFGLVFAGMGSLLYVVIGWQAFSKTTSIGYNEVLICLFLTLFVAVGWGMLLARIFTRKPGHAEQVPGRVATTLAIILSVYACFWTAMIFRPPVTAFNAPFIRFLGLVCWLPPLMTAMFAYGFHAAPVRTRMIGWSILLFLFGLGAFGVGVFSSFEQIDQFAEAQASTAWPVVPGRVLKAELEVRPGTRGSSVDRATATYAYVFDGQSYTNSRVGLFGGGDNIGSWQADKNAILQARLRSGSSIDVHVNPADPSGSILFPEIRPAMCLFNGLFIFVFGIFGASILLTILLPVPARYRGLKESVAKNFAGAYLNDRQGVFRARLVQPLAAGLFVIVGLVLFVQTLRLPSTSLAPGMRLLLLLYPFAPFVALGFGIAKLFTLGRWESVRRIGNEIIVTGLPPGKLPKINGARATELPSNDGARHFMAPGENLTVALPANGRNPALIWLGV